MTDDERIRRAAFIAEARAENAAGRAELIANVAEFHRTHDGQQDVALPWWLRPPDEPVPARERAPDTSPTDWRFVDPRIAAAIVAERENARALLAELIAAERAHAAEVFAEVLAEERKQHSSERDALRELRIEVAKLASLLAVVRDERAAERAAVLDLPPLPSRPRVN